MEHLIADACANADDLGHEAGRVGDLASGNPYDAAADPAAWATWAAAWQRGFEALTA